MVRPARQQDLPAVFALIRGIPSLPQWEQSSLAETEPEIASAICLKRRLLVEEEKNEVRGFAQYSVLLDEVELECMAVSPDARRQGIGRKLLHAVVAAAEADGASALRLEMRAGNHEAFALYRGEGFLVVGKRASYYRDPVEDAILLQRAC